MRSIRVGSHFGRHVNSHGRIKRPRVNRVLLNSIPLNRKVKRYWEEKYCRLVVNNGKPMADKKFTGLRTSVMAYRADPRRHLHPEDFYKSSGFRNNGMLRRLYEYADTNPNFVLSFLKIYTGDDSYKESSEAVNRASVALRHELECDVKSQGAIPQYLEHWVEMVFADRKFPSRSLSIEYQTALKDKSAFYHRMAKEKSLDEWLDYWMKWYNIFRIGWKRHYKSDAIKFAFPEVYADSWINENKNVKSKSFNRDLADLAINQILLDHNSSGAALPTVDLSYVRSYLSPEVQDTLSNIQTNRHGHFRRRKNLSRRTLLTSFEDALIYSDADFLSGQRVGHISHIPKKGTGSDLRDIAVPNRFIQEASAPFAQRLYTLLSVLPKDATFDQDRFNQRIQNRVNNPNLYQGSVDLHHASNNLPVNWTFYILDHWFNRFGTTSLVEIDMMQRWGLTNPSTADRLSKLVAAYHLSKTVASGYWEDNGELVRFGHTVRGVLQGGQPLGFWPSFAELGVTHNIICESMAAYLGLTHSPYWVLGDDLVVSNRKLRSFYIKEFRSRAIPLSLQKSYEGELSEFAGKVFVKNSLPFYSTDHAQIRYNNLFDWQRATGIRIPYKYLPKSVINRMVNDCARVLLPDPLSRSLAAAIKKGEKGATMLGPAILASNVRLKSFCRTRLGLPKHPDLEEELSTTYYLRRVRRGGTPDFKKALSNFGFDPYGATYSSYVTAQQGVVIGKGSHVYPLPDRDSDQYATWLDFIRLVSNTEKITPSGDLRSSIVDYHGSPLRLLSPRFADKDGHFMRYKPVQIPSWYRDKFRPDTTSKLLASASLAAYRNNTL